MFAALWGRIQGWALTALAVLLVLVGAYTAGGRAARRSVEVERTRTLEKAKGKRDEAVAEIDRLDDDSVRERARQRLRDGER